MRLHEFDGGVQFRRIHPDFCGFPMFPTVPRRKVFVGWTRRNQFDCDKGNEKNPGNSAAHLMPPREMRLVYA